MSSSPSPDLSTRLKRLMISLPNHDNNEIMKRAHNEIMKSAHNEIMKRAHNEIMKRAHYEIMKRLMICLP